MDEKELLKNLNARCFELHEKQHAFVSPKANSDFLPLIAKINIKICALSDSLELFASCTSNYSSGCP